MKRIHIHAFLVATLLTLSACGGGEEGGDAQNSSVSAPAVPSLRGLAATGAPIGGATLLVMDAQGSRTYSTDADGHFSIALTELQPPALLKVTLSDGRHLLSLWDGSLQGSSGTTNITPLSDAVVTVYAQNLGVSVADLTPSQLNEAPLLAQAKNTVLQLVADGLRAAGLDPSSMDLLNTPFQANGTGFDAVLDSISFERNADGDIVLYPKQLVLSGDQAPQAPQPLSAATPLKTVTIGQSFLTTAMLNQWRGQINACMQLPVAERAPSSSCAGIYPTRYKNDGVNFQTNFFAESGEDNTVGAQFETPNILSLSRDALGSQAIVEIRWVQPKTGTSHSRVSVFRDLGADGKLQDNQVASATGSSWWLWGNQNDWEVRIEPRVTRFLNLNPMTQSISPSNVTYGLHILINDSMLQGSQWVDAGISYAKVQGAGLPDAGLVLAPVDKTRFDSNYLAIVNADGSAPSTTPPSDVNEYRLAAEALATDSTDLIAPWWQGLSASSVDHRATMLDDFSTILRQTPYKVSLHFKNGSVKTMTVRLTGTLKKLQDKQITWPEFLDIAGITSQLKANISSLRFAWSSSTSTLKPESSFLFASAPALPGCPLPQRWSLQTLANPQNPAVNFQSGATSSCKSGKFPGDAPDALSNIGLKALQDGVRYYSVLGWQSETTAP